MVMLDPDLDIPLEQLFIDPKLWDIVLIMTDGPLAYQKSLIPEVVKAGNIDARIMRFYPKTILHDWVGFIGEEVDDAAKLKRRYRQATRSGDVNPLEISLDGFERPEDRLIGGNPDPLRHLLLYDDFVHKGRTVASCAKDFVAMGYNPTSMWYASAKGRNVFSLSGLQSILPC